MLSLYYVWCRAASQRTHYSHNIAFPQLSSLQHGLVQYYNIRRNVYINHWSVYDVEVSVVIVWMRRVRACVCVWKAVARIISVYDPWGVATRLSSHSLVSRLVSECGTGWQNTADSVHWGACSRHHHKRMVSTALFLSTCHFCPVSKEIS